LIADSQDSDKLKKITRANVKGDKWDSVTFRGAYNWATAYNINDIVTFTNWLSYIAILWGTGNVPTNVTYWSPLITPLDASETVKWVVEVATDAEFAAGTNLNGWVALVPKPWQIKAKNDVYDDAIVRIKDKVDVVCATTANITLSGTQTIDWVAVTAWQRVLVKNQSTASQNGIYLCSAWAWTRTTDFDANANNEVDLWASVWVQWGTTQAGSEWKLTTTGAITVGTTALAFWQSYPILLSDIWCRATQSLAQSMAFAAWTTITFNTEDYDTSSFHDNVTNNSRITIPAGLGGIYSVVWATASTSNSHPFTHVRVNKNWTEVSRSPWVAAATWTPVVPSFTPRIATILKLAAWDYIELQVYNAFGSAQNNDPAYTEFIVQKIA
jgi:hypothetical protein